MTDKKIITGFREQFQTGKLFTGSNVLVLMGYARGDARKMIKEKILTKEDIEQELIETEYPTFGNETDNARFRTGIRFGAALVIDYMNKLL